jgi:hypothetical protein
LTAIGVVEQGGCEAKLAQYAVGRPSASRRCDQAKRPAPRGIGHRSGQLRKMPMSPGMPPG